MKVLILAIGSAGFGETLMGVSLAKQLLRRKHAVHCVIDKACERVVTDERVPATILEPQMGPLVRVLLHTLIMEFRPTIIVLADYLTYCGVCLRRYSLDPWFISEYGLPIIPINVWEWQHTDFSIDIYAKKQLSISEAFRDMPVSLCPVPLCHEIQEEVSSHRALPYELCSDMVRVSGRTRQHLRESLEVPDGVPLVMVAFAKWQMPTLADENGNRIARAVPALLGEYLRRLPENIYFLAVGQQASVFDGLASDRVRCFPECAPGRFDLLLSVVDLFITLNVGATTLAKALASGAQGLVLTNRYAVSGEASDGWGLPDQVHQDEYVSKWIGENAPLYPFRMWPLGFYQFLEPLLKNNRYVGIFEECELLHAEDVVGTCERLLFDESVIHRYRGEQEAYYERIKQLGSGADAFEEGLRWMGL